MKQLGETINTVFKMLVALVIILGLSFVTSLGVVTYLLLSN